MASAPRYALMLHELDTDGPRGLEVVRIGDDPDMLKSWYLDQLAPVPYVQGGQTRSFQMNSLLWNHRAAPDIGSLNKPEGGIWEIPAGTEVQLGWRMVPG